MTRLTPEREQALRERARRSLTLAEAVDEIDALREDAAAHRVQYAASEQLRHSIEARLERSVEHVRAEERAARSLLEYEHRAHCERLTADVERLTRERDALAARVIEEHATYDALRADRDRLRRDLDVRIHGPAGRLYTSED